MNIQFRKLPKGTWLNLHIGPGGKHNVRPLVIALGRTGVGAWWLRGHNSWQAHFPTLRMRGVR